MDPDDDKAPQNLSWWIASLAMSIVFCAVFVGYVFDIKEDLNNSKIRAEIIEQRMDVMASEVDTLRRHMMVQQIQLVPAPTDKAMPQAAEPEPEKPLNETQPAEIKMAPAPSPLPPVPASPQPPKP